MAILRQAEPYCKPIARVIIIVVTDIPGALIVKLVKTLGGFVEVFGSSVPVVISELMSDVKSRKTEKPLHKTVSLVRPFVRTVDFFFSFLQLKIEDTPANEPRSWNYAAVGLSTRRDTAPV